MMRLKEAWEIQTSSKYNGYDETYRLIFINCCLKTLPLALVICNQ